MARGNPNLQKARESRIKKGPEEFFFKVNDRIRVTRDAYNLIIAVISVTQDTGKKYQVNKGFFNTLHGVCNDLSKNYSVSENDIASFKSRTTGIKSYYINNRLKIDVPEGIKFDERDVLSDPDDTTTEKDDSTNDTESSPDQ